jgi:hypothetical protein
VKGAVTVFESTGTFATGTAVVAADGPQDRWTVMGSCGCVPCQRKAFQDGEPMPLVIRRDWDGLVGTCVPQDRVTPVAEVTAPVASGQD